MEVCPYLEETFKILGRSWNGLIINYLSRCNDCSAHFSDMKRDLKTITSEYIKKNKKLIDKERVALWGWSYGGFVTLKTLEYDKGEVFKYVQLKHGRNHMSI